MPKNDAGVLEVLLDRMEDLSKINAQIVSMLESMETPQLIMVEAQGGKVLFDVNKVIKAQTTVHGELVLHMRDDQSLVVNGEDAIMLWELLMVNAAPLSDAYEAMLEAGEEEDID